MIHEGPLDLLPLWAFFLLSIVFVLIAMEIGYRLGRYRRRHAPREKEAPVGAMVAATIGLLAFFLAFTFGLAATRFDARRQLVLEEANAIGTTYLRAAMLPDPQRGIIRQHLRDYVDTRIAVAQPEQTPQAVRQSEALHNLLWEQATALAEKNSTSIILGLFIQSLNDVIDIHAKRVLIGLRSRIPHTIWYVLLLVSLWTMLAMGYHAGLSETARSPAAFVMAFTLAAVILLIADLDRPREGLLQVSQQSMIDLRDSMKGP